MPCIKNGTPTWSGRRTIAVNQELRQAIKDKKRHHRKWIKSLNRGEEESERKLYKASRNKVKRLMNQAKRDHEKYICSQANQNPKIFWKHVRSCLKTKAGVSPLKSPQHHGLLKFSDLDKANILQDQFCNVFTNEPPGDLPEFHPRTTKSVGINLTIDIVRREILSINSNKALGPDEIHPLMLKNLVILFLCHY